jgi:hypothetical protein
MQLIFNSCPISLTVSDKNRLKHEVQFTKIRRKLLGAIWNYMNHAMQMYGGVKIQLQAFLSSAQDGNEWLASCPSHYIHKERTLVPVFLLFNHFSVHTHTSVSKGGEGIFCLHRWSRSKQHICLQFI